MQSKIKNHTMAQQLFYNACSTGDLATVESLLTPPQTYPHKSIIRSHAVNPVFSSYASYVTIYPILLYNFSLHIACKHGHTSIVRLLLSYESMRKNIDLCMSNHFAIRIACRNGFVDIVRLLVRFKEETQMCTANLTLYPVLYYPVLCSHIRQILDTPQLFAKLITVDVANMNGLYSHGSFTYITNVLQIWQYHDVLGRIKQKRFMRIIGYLLHCVLRWLPLDVAIYICTF